MASKWGKVRLLVKLGAFTFNDKSRAYKLEGDQSLYTEDKLAERARIKDDAELAERVRKWWSMMAVTPQGELPKDAYVTLSIKLQKAILRDFDHAEAAAEALLDWEADVGGAHMGTMSFEQFHDSMFELADHWCETVERAEYLAFFDQLLHAIVVDVNAQHMSFKDESDIHLEGRFAEASPLSTPSATPSATTRKQAAADALAARLGSAAAAAAAAAGMTMEELEAAAAAAGMTVEAYAAALGAAQAAGMTMEELAAAALAAGMTVEEFVAAQAAAAAQAAEAAAARGQFGSRAGSSRGGLGTWLVREGELAQKRRANQLDASLRRGSTELARSRASSLATHVEQDEGGGAAARIRPTNPLIHDYQPKEGMPLIVSPKNRREQGQRSEAVPQQRDGAALLGGAPPLRLPRIAPGAARPPRAGSLTVRARGSARALLQQSSVRVRGAKQLRQLADANLLRPPLRDASTGVALAQQRRPQRGGAQWPLAADSREGAALLGRGGGAGQQHQQQQQQQQQQPTNGAVVERRHRAALMAARLEQQQTQRRALLNKLV